MNGSPVTLSRDPDPLRKRIGASIAAHSRGSICATFSIETALPAWMDVSHLPGTRLDEHAPVADRWKKALGKLPD